MKQNFALLCIDLQKEYFDKKRPLFISGGSKVLQNVTLLLKAAREKKITVVHVKHISSNPMDTTFKSDTSFIEFMSETAPQHETVIIKHLPGAFSRTNLDEYLKASGVTNIIVCGLTSFLCCDTTSREAHSRGYNVYFINDATAALDIFGIPTKQIHRIVCAVQKWYFAKVMNTKQIIKMIYLLK